MTNSKAQRIVKKSVTKFFRSISSSLNVINFHADEADTKDNEASDSAINTATKLLKITDSISNSILPSLKTGSNIDIETADISMRILKKKVDTDGGKTKFKRLTQLEIFFVLLFKIVM